MQYLSPILSVEIDPQPLAVVSRVASPTRGAPAESLEGFIDRLDIRLVSPAVLQVAPGTPVENMSLIRLGFRLKMPDEIQVQWLRFSVKILHSAGEGLPNRPSRILSFLPQRVTEDLAYDGRIAIDDSGMIHRSLASLETTGTTRFNRFLLGYQTRQDRLAWDFMPVDGGPIAGSDNLLLTAKIPVEGESYLTEAVQLCIAHPQYGQGSFEYPQTNKIVRKIGIQ